MAQFLFESDFIIKHITLLQEEIIWKQVLLLNEEHNVCINSII